METSKAWVELALNLLDCNQTELARKLSVSSSQISKWRAGDYISLEKIQKFRNLLSLEENRNPAVVLWAGSLEHEAQWTQLIKRLAADAASKVTGGSEADVLGLDDGVLSTKIVDTFSWMGVAPPKAFPQELLRDKSAESNLSDEASDSESEEFNVLIEANPYSRTIRAIFRSTIRVWAFYKAYIEEHFPADVSKEMDDAATELRDNIIALAAAQIKDVDERFAPNIHEFRRAITGKYKALLKEAKARAFREGKSLRAELMDLVSGDMEDSGGTADVEQGLNSDRLHPDIYMNELLVGMRLLHQVLPKVLEALNIDFEPESFTLNRPRPS